MKDFYNIAEMSAQFAKKQIEWKDQKVDIPIQTEIQLYQARFMLAIAQQVSIVASHLGKIVRTAKETTE